MKRGVLIVLLFSCILVPCPVFAQQHNAVPVRIVIDSLYTVLKTTKEDTDKVNILNKLAGEMINTGNCSTTDSLAGSALQLAEKLNFKKGQAAAYNNIGNTYWNQGDYPNALKNYSNALEIYEEIENKRGMGTAYNNIGLVYYELGDYPNALKNHFAALKIAEETGDKQIIASSYNNIGMVYDKQNDYSNALKDYNIELKIAEDIGNKYAIGISYGNIGSIYSEEGSYSDALKNQLQSLKIDEEIGNKQGIATAYINMGEICQNQGNYRESLINYLPGLKIAEEIGNKLTVGWAYVGIESIFIKQEKYAEAKKYLDSALTLSKDIGNKDMIGNIYADWAKLDSATGNYKAAYHDYKMYIVYRDKLKNEENTKKLVSEQMNYEFDKKMAAQKAEQDKAATIRTAENKRKSIIAYSVIIILTLTLIFAINSQQIKRKKEKIIFEKEKQQMETEFANAKAVLEDYVKNMMEKNRLLEQFKADFEKIEKLKAKEIEESRMERLGFLNKTTILTNEDWDKFKGLFEQVYNGFFIRLKEKLPDLTQAEIRLICLIKLKIGTKEISAILGISSNTVNKTRYRLRKKLGLSREEYIKDIVKSI